MSRTNTSKIKKEVMLRISKLLPDSEVASRKLIKSPKKSIIVWASRDYSGEEGVGNWYGFFENDLAVKADTILLFTTGDVRNFLMISRSKFSEVIEPFLRRTRGGYFFLIRRKNGSWFLPKDYVPLNLRSNIPDLGVDLTQFSNNLTDIGKSYDDYIGNIKDIDIKSDNENTDLSAMIKLIADKDPTFLAKSTEEKIIIIRYNQLINKNGN